ncbi:PqqD family protein [Peribacillus sp. SCS-37]|uniref:PqqD family protein n=1 Tax=Paraperibacillus esterisolvens TaxID=3115296 RepID=UPI0039064005
MSLYIQRKNYEAAQLEDEWVILNTDTFTITRLNEAGGACWSLLKEAHSAESLSRELGSMFSAEAHHLRKDVEVFLQELAGVGLIQHAG